MHEASDFFAFHRGGAGQTQNLVPSLGDFSHGQRPDQAGPSVGAFIHRWGFRSALQERLLQSLKGGASRQPDPTHPFSRRPNLRTTYIPSQHPTLPYP